MNDRQDAFERELKTMLSVNPPSDLHARIRACAYATPVRRTRWFGLASALAASVAVIVLVVISMEPAAPQIAPSFPEVTAKTTPPPALPAEAPIQPSRSFTTAAPRHPKNAMNTVQATTAATDTVLQSGKIELPPLTGFELTNSLEPIPQAPVLSIVRLEPISIEPLSLTVHNLGVNE